MQKAPKRTYMRRVAARPFSLFSMFFFDPRETWRVWRGIPYFFRNAWKYRLLDPQQAFRLTGGEIYYRTYDRFTTAAGVPSQYFHQDLWAARFLHDRGVREHVDVGSRIDGFVAHILPFCRVDYVDIRPLDLDVEGFDFRQGSIVELPYETDSVPSLSSLHVLEHIGLGRYGDPIDPQGYEKAARELSRVLKPGGVLLLGTPVGRERVCFDAHRVFDPATVLAAFGGLRLVEFALVDDRNALINPATIEQGQQCEYGCGLFVFTKD